MLAMDMRRGGYAYFRLVFASVATLAIPPLGTITVDNMASCAVDGDVGTGDGDQGTFPLFVCESGCALEGDLRHVRI
jgi:hypothetical protein